MKQPVVLQLVDFGLESTRDSRADLELFAEDRNRAGQRPARLLIQVVPAEVDHVLAREAISEADAGYDHRLADAEILAEVDPRAERQVL